MSMLELSFYTEKPSIHLNSIGTTHIYTQGITGSPKLLTGWAALGSSDFLGVPEGDLHHSLAGRAGSSTT